MSFTGTAQVTHLCEVIEELVPILIGVAQQLKIEDPGRLSVSLPPGELGVRVLLLLSNTSLSTEPSLPLTNVVQQLLTSWADFDFRHWRNNLVHMNRLISGPIVATRP